MATALRSTLTTGGMTTTTISNRLTLPGHLHQIHPSPPVSTIRVTPATLILQSTDPQRSVIPIYLSRTMKRSCPLTETREKRSTLFRTLSTTSRWTTEDSSAISATVLESIYFKELSFSPTAI